MRQRFVSSDGDSDSTRVPLRSAAFSSFLRCFSSILARATRARSAQSLPKFALNAIGTSLVVSGLEEDM
jgi:hypothetical protein